MKNRIAGQLRPTIPLLILPTLHLILCFAIEFSISDDAGGWKWFPLGLIDYPFSSILKQAGFLEPFLVFTIFGTLWWYFIAMVLRFVFGIGPFLANRFK